MIVEDGSGLPNSNSYASLAAAQTYCDERGIIAWDAPSDPEREYALIKATDYIDRTYVFRSVKATDAQALEHPRFPFNDVPPEVVKATIMLAIHMLTVNTDVHVAQRDIVEIEEAIDGAVSSKIVYSDSAIGDPFPEVTKTLAKMASRRGASGGTIRLVR